MRPTSRVLLVVLFAGLALRVPCPSPCQAQQAASEKPEVEFPTEWVGSAPLSADVLRGKAMLLYFYEEQCPKCKGEWPEILAAARKFSDQPIVFIAVNSGTSRGEVEQYVREVGLDWPVIVDVDRSFETNCGIVQVNLQNIAQVAYINAQGQVRLGKWSDLEGTVQQALAGAKWNVDPSDIPDDLKPAWRSIEFGDYAAAAPALAKIKSARKPEIKAAGQKLLDYVDQRIAGDLDAAKAEASPYRAHEQHTAIAQRFAGYPAAEKATAARRALAGKPAYKKELAAMKLFERQQQLAASDKPAVRQRALAALQKLVDDAPDSEAARRAREVLAAK